MAAILASKLSGKEVLTKDGKHVGEVHNVTMDIVSGDLETLVVDTDRTEIFDIEQSSDGHVHLPASVLASVSDHAIISQSRHIQ